MSNTSALAWPQSYLNLVETSQATSAPGSRAPEVSFFDSSHPPSAPTGLLRLITMLDLSQVRLLRPPPRSAPRPAVHDPTVHIACGRDVVPLAFFFRGVFDYRRKAPPLSAIPPFHRQDHFRVQCSSIEYSRALLNRTPHCFSRKCVVARLSCF